MKIILKPIIRYICLVFWKKNPYLEVIIRIFKCLQMRKYEKEGQDQQKLFIFIHTCSIFINTYDF